MSKNDIGRPDWLTQVKPHPDRIEIIDHADHGPNPAEGHVVTVIKPDGSMTTEYR